jgi:hypothetical protein
MTLSSVGTRIRRRAKSAVFLARLHPLLRMWSPRLGQDCFITCSGKHDGAGAQALAVLSTMLFADRVGMQYVHTPFQRISQYTHTSYESVVSSTPELTDKWEKFFNLGEGEISLSQAASLRLERVPLNTLTELPFGRTGTLYVARHCHEYANFFPEQYVRIVDRFARKYYSCSKGDLQSYYDPSRLNIAIHVRRGEVAQHGKHASRYTTNRYVASIVRDVLSASGCFALPPSVHLYSEGQIGEFGPLQDMDIAFHLNECPFSTFNNLVSADVLLMSKSTFSYVSALLSHGVKLYQSFRGTPLNHKPLGHWIVVDENGRVNQKNLRQALAPVVQRALQPRNARGEMQ